jgi:fructose-1,6-bisphosphatase/inositol monophosphatase family enzyme
VLGEEMGLTGSGPHRWVLDPVHGTCSFICGVPVGDTLIGLTIKGRAALAMMSQPFARKPFWADTASPARRRRR